MTKGNGGGAEVVMCTEERHITSKPSKQKHTEEGGVWELFPREGSNATCSTGDQPIRTQGSRFLSSHVQTDLTVPLAGVLLAAIPLSSLQLPALTCPLSRETAKVTLWQEAGVELAGSMQGPYETRLSGGC